MLRDSAKKVPLFTLDSYASRWIIHTDPKLRLISKIKSSIKSCVGHTYVCDYEVGCRIVALKSWYLYNKFPTKYPGDHLLFGDWGWDKIHTTDSYRLFHGPWNGLVVGIHCYFDDCRMLAYSIMACEVCMIWRKPIVTCKSQYHLASQRLAALQWSHQYIQLDYFTAHDACRRAYQNHHICRAIWNVEQFNSSHKYFKDAKETQIKDDFDMKLKILRTWSKMFCIFWSTLSDSSWDVWCYPADKLVIGENIQTQTQTQTRTQTHTHTQATTIPEGPKCPRIKNILSM